MVAIKGVIIDSGPMSRARNSLNTPPEDWPELIKWRRDFISTHFEADCRGLIDFLWDAPHMWKQMGYANVDALVRDGLGIDPDSAHLVVEWLKRYRPDQPVGLPEALQRARLMKRGRPSRENKVDNYQLKHDGGTDPRYLEARIERDRPDILARLDAGEFRSVRAAAIEAGIIDPDKSKRYSLPADPEAAARYLRERVDEDWLVAMLEAWRA